MQTNMSINSVQIIENAKTIAETILRPLAADIDQSGNYPTEGLKALGDNGYWGLTISRQHGGLGSDLLTTVKVIEKLAEACPSTAMCFKMHLEAINPIKELATKEQINEFLRPIAAGELFAGVAANEAGRGPGNIASLAMQNTSGDFILENCHKSFVTSAHFADIFSLIAKHDPSTTDITSFLVRRNTPNSRITVDSTWNGFGMRGNDSCSMTFAGSIPASGLVGTIGGWKEIRPLHIPFVFLSYAGVYLGIASGAFREMVTQVTGRYSVASDVPETVRKHLGESKVTLEATRALLYRAAAEVDAGTADLELCMASCVSADETALKITDVAMLLGGGSAYAKRTPVERYLRDAHAGRIMVPQDEQTKLNLGSASLGTM